MKLPEKCDKCGVKLDDTENYMIHRNTPDGDFIDLCPKCFKEYDKVCVEASREFNQKIQNWIDEWKHGGE